MRGEAALARRMGEGDQQALEEFVDLYGARAHRLVRRHVAHEADAEDITQEVFLDLYRSIGGFRGESSLATWVYRVTLNHCLRYRERQRPAGESYEEDTHATPDPGSDPARFVAQRELSAQVQGALGNLSTVQRDVVILHELHGLTYRECAGVLGVPVGTVKSRLANAFRCLRGSLGAYVLGEASALVEAASRPEVLGEKL